MELDLNDRQNLTIKNVAKLIASKNDSADRQLRVKTDGVAYLSDDVAADNIEGLAFRLETWDSGNDYVGIAASEDEGWVRRVHKCLSENWPIPKSRYICLF
jgi:hypothetical protein